MKKSNIILISIVSLSLLSMLYVLLELKREVNKWLNEEPQEAKTELLSSSIQSIIVNDNVDVKFQLNDKEASLAHYSPIRFHEQEDTLFIDKNLSNVKVKVKVKVNIGDKVMESKDDNPKIQINLPTISSVELGEESLFKVKEDIDLEDLYIHTYENSAFRAEHIKAKNVYLSAQDTSRINIKGLQCDTLFVEALQKAEIYVYMKRSKIKYISATVKDTARVQVPPANNINSVTDNENNLRVL